MVPVFGIPDHLSHVITGQAEYIERFFGGIGSCTAVAGTN
jgi:hypothetical protein